MRIEYRNAILHQIENIFGRPIVSQRDCLDLALDIFEKTSKHINVNTLRRFFGLIKSEYLASQMTLNILSQYCGFRSAEDAYQFKQNATLTQFHDHNNLVYYFTALFDKIIVQNSSDKTFLLMVEQTIEFLNSHRGLADKFQRLVAATKNGQDFYFEQFVNVDKFNVYFRNGLIYYMNEKKSNDASIFVQSVMIFNFWLNNDDAKVEEHFSQLTKLSTSGPVNGYIHSRYYAAILFHAHIKKQAVEDILVTIYKYYINLEASAKLEELFYFEYVISEALVLTGNFNDGQFYIDQFCQRSAKLNFRDQRISVQNIKLFKTIALKRTGEPAEAIAVFNSIKPTEFHFTSRLYAAILFTYLRTELRKKVSSYESSYQLLINETGFARLQQLFPLGC